MRYQGNVVENLLAAWESQDERLVKDILVDEMARIIETNPKEMVKTLQYSNVEVKDTATQQELVKIASYNLYNNPLFQKNLAVTLVKKGGATKSDYASAVGKDTDGVKGKGGSKLGGASGLIGAVSGMISSIGKWGSSRNTLKTEEERTKAMMFEKIFGQQQKRNWLPIIVVSGVLLIGAIVVWRTTAKSN